MPKEILEHEDKKYLKSVEAIKVLDHGYVRLVEDWGRGDAGESEAGIIEAARQSTVGSFRGWKDRNEQCPECSDAPAIYEHENSIQCHRCKGKGYIVVGDERLLKFLYSNKPQHATPFEFAGMVIEVQAPIFVFREWHRHRTQSYNEMSARYTPLPDVNYVPSVERLLINANVYNKQANTIRGAEVLTLEGAEAERAELIADYADCEMKYQRALKRGVPKELARIRLPVGRYSRMRAQALLRNWLAFMTLRADPGAMWEIQMFAQAVGTILAARFPRTYKLYCEGKV